MKPFALVGNTVEEKLDHAETILRRLARHSRKSVTMLSPVCAISARSQVGLDGEIYRFISPFDGDVKTVYFKVEWGKFKSALLSMGVRRAGTAPGQSFSIKAGINIFPSDIKLKAGDEVVFSLSSITAERVDDVIVDFFTLLSLSLCPVQDTAQATSIAIGSLEEGANEILSN